MNKIQCPVCKRKIEAAELVKLDEINTIIHERCQWDNNLEIVDHGTFEEIIRKYPFFSIDTAF